MFDWNGNGEHDPFDDFVTFGLLEDLINEFFEITRFKRFGSGKNRT